MSPARLQGRSTASRTWNVVDVSTVGSRRTDPAEFSIYLNEL